MENEETTQETQPEVEKQEVGTQDSTHKKKSKVLMYVKWTLIAAALLFFLFLAKVVNDLSNALYTSPGEPLACSQEAKICPDGSSVGRTGPNCEFAECPVIEGQLNQESFEEETDLLKIPEGTQYRSKEYLFGFYHDTEKFPVKYIESNDSPLYSYQLLPAPDALAGITINVYKETITELLDIFKASNLVVKALAIEQEFPYTWEKYELLQPDMSRRSISYLITKNIYTYQVVSAALINDLGDIIKTFEFFVPEDTYNPEPPGIDTSDWLSYTNDEFGFEIQLPPTYKEYGNYSVEQEGSSFEFLVPYWEPAVSPWSAFAIYGMPISEWDATMVIDERGNAFDARYEDPSRGLFLGKNSEYAFLIHPGHDSLPGIDDNETFDEIVSTFSLLQYKNEHIDSISPSGQYQLINTDFCDGCDAHPADYLVRNVETGEETNIGSIINFEWYEDDRYRYKVCKIYANEAGFKWCENEPENTAWTESN